MRVLSYRYILALLRFWVSRSVAALGSRSLPGPERSPQETGSEFLCLERKKADDDALF